jgi:hypothetical protein
MDPFADDRADHRVEPRAVAAAGQDADAHGIPPGTLVAEPVLVGVMMPQVEDVVA